MIKAVFKDKSELDIVLSKEEGFSGKIGGKEFNWDITQNSSNRWSIIDENGESFEVEALKNDEKSDNYTLKIDGSPIELTLKSEFDLLLQKLGISKNTAKKLDQIKAPMPGLVHNVMVSVDQDVKEGDALIILEAMKMENVIKAPADGKVKDIKVSKAQSLEKGEVMIVFH